MGKKAQEAQERQQRQKQAQRRKRLIIAITTTLVIVFAIVFFGYDDVLWAQRCPSDLDECVFDDGHVTIQDPHRFGKARVESMLTTTSRWEVDNPCGRDITIIPLTPAKLTEIYGEIDLVVNGMVIEPGVVYIAPDIEVEVVGWVLAHELGHLCRPDDSLMLATPYVDGATITEIDGFSFYFMDNEGFKNEDLNMEEAYADWIAWCQIPGYDTRNPGYEYMVKAWSTRISCNEMDTVRVWFSENDLWSLVAHMMGTEEGTPEDLRTMADWLYTEYYNGVNSFYNP